VVTTPTTRRWAVRPTGEGHKVTTLELFFDLVFVFAITQVTAFMSDDLSARGALRGIVLFALLWWAWSSYAWLTNQVRADEGVLRATLVAVMAALFVVGLAVPEAWDDRGGGPTAGVVLAGALAFVRLAHIAVFAYVAADDHDLRRQLVRMGLPVSVAAAVLVVGAILGGPAQTLLWLLALAIDYTGVYVAGATGWRLPAPGHFAERHGLIVIVALGESIVAIGIGVSGLPLTWPVVVTAVLGLAVSVALWWTYFDVVALVAERVLTRADPVERVRLARDSYTYLHFPMIAGIIFLALGMKKVMSYVADADSHDLSDPLHGIGLYALYGGACAYLLGHLAFRYRNISSVNKPRAIAAAVLVVMLPVADRVPALAALGMLAGVLISLVTYEAVHYGEGRRRIREEHG
jgi:low temperature requirement protein LtrA